MGNEIKLLYCVPDFVAHQVARKNLSQIKTEYRLNIRLKCVSDLADLYIELKRNSYDIIIIHDNIEKKDDGEKISDDCKRAASNEPLLILESNSFYFDSKSDVLKHFDDYSNSIVKDGVLEELLLKHNLIGKGQKNTTYLQYIAEIKGDREIFDKIFAEDIPHNQE